MPFNCCLTRAHVRASCAKLGRKLSVAANGLIAQALLQSLLHPIERHERRSQAEIGKDRSCNLIDHEWRNGSVSRERCGFAAAADFDHFAKNR